MKKREERTKQEDRKRFEDKMRRTWLNLKENTRSKMKVGQRPNYAMKARSINHFKEFHVQQCSD
jgi:hypothetical protein